VALSGCAPHLPHIVWTAEPDGSIDFVSRLDTYTGLDVSQLKGWNRTSVVHPDNVQSALANWRPVRYRR
jgi:hypothetical protein